MVQSRSLAPPKRGLVSVVIPHFNAGATIGAAVKSVQSQTYVDWEVILVDDCSTDPVSELLEELASQDARISLVQLPVNSGTPASPRNHGIDHAQGEFLAFLDADDLWHPRKLELQVELLQRQNASLCSCRVYTFEDEPDYLHVIERTRLRDRLPYHTLTHERLIFKNLIKSGSSVLLRREVLGNMRFNEDPAYRAIEDYEFWLYLHQYSIDQSYYIRFPLVGYRLSESSISKSKLFMIRQHYRLYRDYRINGAPLGWKRHLCMLSYAVLSILAVVRRAVREKRSEWQAQQTGTSRG